MRRQVVLLTGALLLTFVGTARAQEPAMVRQDTWSARQAGLTVLAQDAGRGGRGVTVAVLDTWVDSTHPDFEDRALPEVDCTGGSCRAGRSRDACEHGTHVAGSVASSSYGAAPEVTVLPIRVMQLQPSSGACSGTPEDVAAGIRYALTRGARVINLSLSADTTGTDDGPLSEAVSAAVAAGAVVVLSAGNEAAPVVDRAGSEALVVAATASNGGLAAYSPRGGGVDLAAPGGDAVPSCDTSTCITSLFSDGRYALAAGTSMSAPMVSGIAALLLGQRPSRTASDVRTLLLSTAKPLDGAGAGLIDASAALGVAPVQDDPDEVPLGLGVGAVMLVLATGTATVLVRRTT